MIERSTGQVRRPLPLLALVTGLLVGPSAGEVRAQYNNFSQALNAGAGALNARQYENARAPLEYALKAATDDAGRLQAHAMLTSVYFHAGQTDKVINSLDFILTHSASEPQRAMVRRAMINYVTNQGKAGEVRDLYEDRLKANPEDVAALYVLSDIYSKVLQNPQRAGELVTKLAEVLKKNGGSNDPYVDPNLAGQFVKAGKIKEGAAMYERIAANDPKMAGVYYKDAAQAWLKAGDKAKALAAARNADNSLPESRTGILEYFYHRGLGDIYFATNEPALAAEHFEQAIAKSTVDGYTKDTRKLLEQAKTLVARRAGTTKPAPTTGSATTTSDARSPSSAPAGKGGAVDLNKASLSQLQGVDGITEAIAIQIIDHRKSKPFESVSELIELDGVDKAALAKIRSKVSVGPGR